MILSSEVEALLISSTAATCSNNAIEVDAEIFTIASVAPSIESSSNWEWIALLAASMKL